MVSTHDLTQFLHADLTIVINVKQGKGLLDQEIE